MSSASTMSSVGMVTPQSSSHGMLNDDHVPFLHSAKAHKRFTLRAVAISAASVGLVLNFTTLMVAVTARNSRGPAIVTGFAFIPLVLSLIWHHLDLASHRLLGREIPAQLLLFMETLGFLGFLAVLIANGIVSADYEGIPRWDGIKALPPLMIYNSVPWLVCSTVHLILVHQEVLRHVNRVFGTFAIHRGNGCSYCTHCRSEWSMQTRKPRGDAGYSFVSPQEQYDAGAEVERGTVSVEETRQTESTPLTAAVGGGV